RDHGEAIRSEGFRLAPLAWRRRGGGVFGGLRALQSLVRLYCAEQPGIVHHVALKPAPFGAIAPRFAFPGRCRRPLQVAAIMGLGSRFGRGGLVGRLLEPALRFAARDAEIIVQNPEDGAALVRLGLEARRIALIRGSGLDIAHFQPLPEPSGSPLAVA